MFMRVWTVVMVSFSLLSWKSVHQNEKTIHLRDKIQSPVNMTDGNKPQHETSYINQSLKEELSFKVLLSTFSGLLSYDTVFCLILIHMCGAGVAATISTMYHHMCWACSFIDLNIAFSVISIILAVRTIYKVKQEKEDVVTTLMKVKTELENQRNQLKDQLKEVEADKEQNKQDLQSVEQEITEREKTFEKPGDLLRTKERLLQTQWKLDQTKKDTKRQLLNHEKLMEPIETLFTRRHRLKDEDVQN